MVSISTSWRVSELAMAVMARFEFLNSVWFGLENVVDFLRFGMPGV